MPDNDTQARGNWSLAEVRALHDSPLFALLDRARAVHQRLHPHGEVQLCSLLSVKTGGCPEDCAYCPQSSHYQTPVRGEAMLKVDEVIQAARAAKAQGATRFCMGAAWREVKDGQAFDRVLDMVREVKALGLEACATLGMLNGEQAQRLKAAGLDAYNHNIDTAPGHYRSIITTREQSQRFSTLKHVREAGLSVCCGGIIGMGESLDDRCQMLIELSRLEPQPESVPINALVRVPGTPLADLPPVEPLQFVRMIACARILLPRARVRLSAGRSELSDETQLLCFYAGANSIFYGDKLLTTENPQAEADRALLASAGLRVLPPQCS